MMTDEELAAYLNLTPAEAAIVLPKLTPEKRKVYERMKQFEIDVRLWLEGKGPKPDDVLIDLDKKWLLTKKDK